MIGLFLSLASWGGEAAAQERFSRGSSAAISADPWWWSLQSAELDGLVRAGLSASPDLQSTLRQADQASALAQQGLAALLPSLKLDSQLSVNPTDALGFGQPALGAFSLEEDTYQTGSTKVSASLGVDLFGRSTLNWLAGRQDAAAAVAGAHLAQLSLSASLVSGWLDVVQHRTRLALLEEQLVTAQTVLELTEMRQRQGTASALDVLQQRQQVASVQALVPQTRGLLRLAEQQVAVLMGRAPTDIPKITTAALPELPPEPALGTPVELLARTPSVRVAEAQDEAARKRASSAWLGLTPTLGVSASYGPQYNHFSEWDVLDVWTVGLSASLPIFQGGAARAGIQAASAKADSTSAALEQATLRAVLQVESALALEQERALALDASRTQRDLARQSFEVARESYRAGLSTYLPVLSAQQTLLQAELSALQVHRDLLSARLQLHTALGSATEGVR